MGTFEGIQVPPSWEIWAGIYRNRMKERNLQLVIRKYVLMLRSGYFFIYILQAPSNIRVSLSKSLEIRSLRLSSILRDAKINKKLDFPEAGGVAQLFLRYLSLPAWAWRSCGKNTPGALPMRKFPGARYWCTSLLWGAGKRLQTSPPKSESLQWDIWNSRWSSGRGIRYSKCHKCINTGAGVEV